MSKHSPGPWRWDSHYLFSENGFAVTRVSDCYLFDPDDADARLIAAAPELLEALKDLWGVAGAVFSGVKMVRLGDLLRRIEGETTGVKP